MEVVASSTAACSTFSTNNYFISATNLLVITDVHKNVHML